MTEKNIVIIGAGVAGLTTALLLSRNPRYRVTVAAKHMPGDYDIEYASPWAGADYLPFSSEGTNEAEWDKNTWPHIRDLAQNHPDAGIHFQRCEIRTRKKDLDLKTRNFRLILGGRDYFQMHVPSCAQLTICLPLQYEEIPKSKLASDIANGYSFTTVCINTAIYLPWLLSQCLKAGVIFKRAVFKHVSHAAAAGVHHSGSLADLIVNCTGLSSLKLGGVEDKLLVPVRGQIVLVRNDAGGNFSLSGTDDGPDESSYMMSRAAGGGTVLGGSKHKGNWESQVDPNLAIRIMKRSVKLNPTLTGGKGIEHLDIIRHGVGLRPFREGGARIEREEIDGVGVVHNYGHGGAGYQSSYGCSEVAVHLIEEALNEG